MFTLFHVTNGAYVMDKDEKTRTLFHVTFDKEQALYLLRKLLTYGVYVEAYVKDKSLVCIRRPDALRLND